MVVDLTTKIAQQQYFVLLVRGRQPDTGTTVILETPLLFRANIINTIEHGLGRTNKEFAANIKAATFQELGRLFG